MQVASNDQKTRRKFENSIGRCAQLKQEHINESKRCNRLRSRVNGLTMQAQQQAQARDDLEISLRLWDEVKHEYDNEVRKCNELRNRVNQINKQARNDLLR